jgi:glycosyltransferase involved in cell wall biosynthesis
MEHTLEIKEVLTDVLLSGCPKSFMLPRQLKGNLDQCDAEGIHGWVIDEANPNKPVELNVFIDDKLITQTTANVFRQDLLDAHIGNGQHGFNISLPNNFFDGMEHTLEIKEVLTGTLLTNFSKKFNVVVKNKSSEIDTLFNEQFYLDANPDVVNAVKKGQVTSGSEHFQLYGYKEGRIIDALQYLVEKTRQIPILELSLAERDARIIEFNRIVNAYENSISWRITKPFRIVEQKFKSVIPSHLLVHIDRPDQLFNVVNNSFIVSGWSVNFRTKAAANIRVRIGKIECQPYLVARGDVQQVLASECKLPVDLGFAVELSLSMGLHQLWIDVENSDGSWILVHHALLLCMSLGQRKPELPDQGLTSIRFHLDHPEQIDFVNIAKGLFLISGWAVDLEAHSAAKVRVRVGEIVHQPAETMRPDVPRAFASICKLPPDVGYAFRLSLPLGMHRVWIDVEGSDRSWITVRQMLLLRMPKLVPIELKEGISYSEWTQLEQKYLKAELSEIVQHIEVMIHKPIFTVVIDTRQSLAGWEKSLQSMRKQIYPYYELRTLSSVGTTLPSVLERETKPLQDFSCIDDLGEFVVFIECGQILSSNALYEFANAINQYFDIDLIYADEDRLNSGGERCNPFYKPDWSPDYLETFNYIGFVSCFRTTIVRSCLDDTYSVPSRDGDKKKKTTNSSLESVCLYDMILRFTEHTTKIWHVAKILGHDVERQIDDDAMGAVALQNISALQGRLNRTGRHGAVCEHRLHRGCYDIHLELKSKPLVSIIIPTAGNTITLGERQIDLIVNVINQIKTHSTYKNIELIIVDNGDLSERQQYLLAAQGCKRITYTDPVFNISKKLNLGATIATGELFLLMNDDIEILSPDWIERMIEHFEKPHVGVVGAKLLYPDEQTIQHVGVVHNEGNPDHVRRHYKRDEAGYYFSTCGVHNYMAVTGAVMMTSSVIYRNVRGYSEELAVSYNDADYCLKVQQQGFLIVYAPQVELIHMESQSRVPSADPKEVSWYHRRWASQIVSDPYYNEQFLTVVPPTFVPYVNLCKI